MSLLWWLVLLVLFGLAILPAVYNKFTAKVDVTFDLYRSTVTSRTLFVHLPGLMGDGETQIHNIMDTFLSRGNVLTVHCQGDYGTSATKFDADLVVYRTVLRVLFEVRRGSYDNVVFIGTSMGGKLAFRIAQDLLIAGVMTKAVLVDAPLCRRDFQAPLNFLSPVLRPLFYIPVLNLIYVIPLVGRLFIQGMNRPPKEDQIEKLTPSERQALDDSVVAAQLTKASYHRDQVMAILKPLENQHSIPWGFRDVVYLRSKDDTDTVRETAYDSWRALFRRKKLYRRVLPGALHSSYGQKPSRYRVGFPQALELIGIR